MTRNVGIYLFPEVEALDFAGPYEVFTTCSGVSKRLNPQQAEPFHVFSISAGLPPVRARAGMRITPDHELSNHPPVDVLIIPGGVITDELQKPGVLQWAFDCAASAELVASVCTGAFILARAGILNNGRVTTHWEDQQELAESFPALEVVNGPRWVDQGKVITSAGTSAGIDMCLHIVSRLCGLPPAEATARQMDYTWAKNHE